MQLFNLLKREIPQPPYLLIGFTVASGMSSAFLIAIVNAAAEAVVTHQMNWKLNILYALCLGITFFSKRYVLDRSTELVESIVNNIRRRLADKIRHTELTTLDKYGTSTLYARISQDATVVSNTSTIIINGSQQAILVVFTLIYIATVSILSFMLVAVGLVIGFLYYSGKSKSFRTLWKAVSDKSTQFFEKFGHILHGFREIKINRLKNENVFRNYVTVNNELRNLRIETSKRYNTILIFIDVFFYLLLGVILFVVPKFQAEHTQVIIKVVASVLFIVGPLDSIIFAISPLANGNSAAENIMNLEAQLEEDLKKSGQERLDPNSPEAFLSLPYETHIELKELSYQYPNLNGNGMSTGFHVGPINLTIQKGELIFVTGGNGSGKTTFLTLFTGLYKPMGGSIKVLGGEGQGELVSFHNYQQYQNLFSTIFSDYHLFDQLYGVEGEIDPGQVNALLTSMDLSPEKVTFKKGGFTNIKLSSGQKKRLALTTALMEDKPIYVFDEVAADLDPEFRDKFYYEILPELKSRNKTILVVSHDQQYWMVPDRLLHFQDGMMRELTKAEVKSLVSIAIKD